MNAGDLLFDWNIFIYLLSLAAVWGGITQRLRELEKKMEKLSCLVEKVYKMEVTLEEQGKDIERVFEKLREKRASDGPA